MIKVIFAADKEILVPAALAVQQDELADMPVAFTLNTLRDITPPVILNAEI